MTCSPRLKPPCKPRDDPERKDLGYVSQDRVPPNKFTNFAADPVAIASEF
jgi:hypothetical protein